MRVVDIDKQGEGWLVGSIMGEVIETVGLRASDFEDAIHGLGGPRAIAQTMIAAPDMLEALSIVADYLMGDDEIPENTVATIRNAIKKARGQT
jgi:hypothetical protein